MKEESRDGVQRIIAAVREVLAEEGVTNLSLRKVATKAGATLGLITHHFPNRDAMVKAVVEAVWEEERNAAKWPERPVKEEVIAAIEVFLPLDDFRRRQLSVWIAFWALAQNEPDLKQIHHDVHFYIRDRHRVWLRALGFGEDRAMVLADRLTMFIDSMVLYSMIDTNHWTPDRVRSTIVAFVDDIFREAAS